MKKIFITLEDVLVDPSGVLRPYTTELIEGLLELNFQVFIWSSRGMEYAKRMHEKLGIPAVHGFFVKGAVDRGDVDLVIDTDPSFMKRYNGYCVNEWNSLRYEHKTAEQLKDVLNKVRKV